MRQISNKYAGECAGCGVERKAAKIEGWAEARERRAASYQDRSDSLMGRDSSGRADWALVTQPGYIPQRAQANRAQERAWEESNVADKHRERAASLRASVRVAGDAEAAREEKREKARAWLRVGMDVKSPMWGVGVVVKINKKTLSMRLSDGRICSEGLHWVMPCKAADEAK